MKNTLFGGTQTTISGAKVQQKMHIRKLSEPFLEKL